jgi:hypothetical protein
MWLVEDDSESFDAAKIRDPISLIDESIQSVVIEVQPKNWATLSRDDPDGKNMTDWLGTNWG